MKSAKHIFSKSFCRCKQLKIQKETFFVCSKTFSTSTTQLPWRCFFAKSESNFCKQSTLPEENISCLQKILSILTIQHRQERFTVNIKINFARKQWKISKENITCLQQNTFDVNNSTSLEIFHCWKQKQFSMQTFNAFRRKHILITNKCFYSQQFKIHKDASLSTLKVICMQAFNSFREKIFCLQQNAFNFERSKSTRMLHC